MAKHSGCPECESLYGAQASNGATEHEANGEQRDVQYGADMQNGRDSPTAIYNPYYTGRPRTPANGSKHTSIDRQEIIRRIKSGGSRPTSPELERPVSRSSLKKRKSPAPEQTIVQMTESAASPPEIPLDNETIGLNIERPRSAFHRGDFREKEDSNSAFERFGDVSRDEQAPSLSTSPVAPWHPDFPSAAFRQPSYAPEIGSGLPFQRAARARATSNVSLASSFIYKPPTSPLVQASRPDTPEPPARQKSRSPDKSRRHTFSPQSLHHFRSALDYPSSARNYGHTQPPSLRAEKTFPYQAHQPRRSLNSFQSLPHTPASSARRPSLSESPLHHASMVGSYEESILRGRMSTTPSKPLNFVAQIGVLGKGDCKPNLRCPPHATVPFPAVFYSYGSSTRAISSTDQPSPYVGLVDLENGLPAPNPAPEKRRQVLQATLSDESSRASSRTREEHANSDAQARRRRRQKQKRRSGSPKAPPGGSYRIPQQGQVQIVIKNPNKTAVKLFLIPYDLSDMEAGQKTFIRQRSYSAGPIIDMPLSSRTNLGTDRPEASLSASDDPNDRPTLRYLVHLHICCPSKGRYFLYKSIRVVFANRVPDGKEKLRNEIQLPEPKYSAYKPGRDSHVGIANPASNSAARRKSVAERPVQPLEPPWPPNSQVLAQSLPGADFNSQYKAPMPPPMFHRSPMPTLDSRPASRQTSDGMDVDSDRSSETRCAFLSPSSARQVDANPIANVKRLDDPFNFERDWSRERKPGGRSESLLSRRLKHLAFQTQTNGDVSN